MQTALTHCSPVKDGRRILGEKDANACQTPTHHFFLKCDSPAAKSLSEALFPRKLLPSPILISKKRTIEEVDEPRLHQPRWGSREHAESQSEEFLGQRSLPPPPQDDSLSNGELGNAKDKQRAGHKEMFEQESHTRVPDSPETRKLFIQEKATLLRSRLQNAMLHVKDLQLDRRISELEAHSRKLPRLSFPPFREDVPIRQAPTSPSPRPRTLLAAAELNQASLELKSALDLSPASTGTVVPKRVSTMPRIGSFNLASAPGSPLQRHDSSAVVVPWCPGDEDGNATLDGEQETVNLRAETESIVTRSDTHRCDAVDGLLRLGQAAESN